MRVCTVLQTPTKENECLLFLAPPLAALGLGIVGLIILIILIVILLRFIL